MIPLARRARFAAACSRTATRLPLFLLPGIALLLSGLGSGGCRKDVSRGTPPPPPVNTERTKSDAASPSAPLLLPPATESIRFKNVATESGIKFRWPAYPRPLRNREAFGRGCAFLDYDGDGWQDVLLVSSPQVRLYRNRTESPGGASSASRRFEDMTEATGLSRIRGDWIGCAVGDYDGDGDLDILLTGYHRLALLRNETGAGGNRRFTDVTAAAGLDPNNRGHWGSSAGFMDLDGDAALDLVVLNYVIFGPGEKQYCEIAPNVISGCPPSEYRPEFGEVWRNRGGGTFQRVDDAVSGMKDTSGKALVLAFLDVDNDGRVDLYIGNDGTPAELMHNQGGMRLKNIGDESGVAYGADGNAIAAMGADWGDYDRDGRLDLIVTAFSNEPYALFRNVGDALFQNEADAVGLAALTRKPLGFGVKWLDMDNDGWLDIVIANGHVYDNVDQIDAGSTFQQPLMLCYNHQGRRFEDMVPRLGGEMADPLLGRGLATADFDNDGRMDFLVVNDEGAPRLFHNRSATRHHWITLDLRSPAGKNRFAYGAKVTARASGGQVWVAEVSPASSYLSSSDPRIHFGLGSSVGVLESVTVRWPSGKTQIWRNVPVDRILILTEGKAVTG